MNNNPLEYLFQMIYTIKNPNQIIQNIVPGIPQAQTLLNQMKHSRMTEQQFVMQYAKQANIDINPLINTLKNLGIKL